MALQEFTTGAEMRAHYHAVRKRLFPDPVKLLPAPVPIPEPEPPEPEHFILASLQPACELIDFGLERLVRAATALACDPLRIAREPVALFVSISDITMVVAHFYGMRVLDLRSQRRTKTLVRPRQIIMYLAATVTNRSLPAIGRAMSKDHTTVLHGRRRIEALLLTDERLRDEVDLITMQLIELDQMNQARRPPMV